VTVSASAPPPQAPSTSVPRGAPASLRNSLRDLPMPGFFVSSGGNVTGNSLPKLEDR
jgi:hypothetical protein